MCIVQVPTLLKGHPMQIHCANFLKGKNWRILRRVHILKIILRKFPKKTFLSDISKHILKRPLCEYYLNFVSYSKQKYSFDGISVQKSSNFVLNSVFGQISGVPQTFFAWAAITVSQKFYFSIKSLIILYVQVRKYVRSFRTHPTSLLCKMRAFKTTFLLIRIRIRFFTSLRIRIMLMWWKSATILHGSIFGIHTSILSLHASTVNVNGPP